MDKQVILASASPRREELLRLVGLKFKIIPSDVDESGVSANTPNNLAERLANAKAKDVSRQVDREHIVIGADTVVVIEGLVLGKPVDKQDAFDKLEFLSGRSHEVITGVSIVDTSTGKESTFHEVTRVTFRSLEPSQIKRYIATGEPMDKAGAYGIQGFGSVLVTSISGDYYNVVGLPVARLIQELEVFDVRVL